VNFARSQRQAALLSCVLGLVPLLQPTALGAAEPTLNTAAAAPSAERASRTPAGTTFTLPAGWTETRRGDALVLSPPEPDFTLTLLDLAAPDAGAAVAAAWKAQRPDFARKLRLTTPSAPRNGWTERVNFEYETSPNERLVLGAAAWKANDRWLVVLIDGAEGTVEKRGGPMNLVLGSLRPAGYERETFAGRTAHPLDAQRLQVLKDFVAAGMERLRVPGVGLAFIDRGKVVWSGGLGVRELGKPEPIDGDSLFIAASNTKAMTTLLLAQLVDEGKLRWDEPVIEAYPGFKLGSDATTKSVQVKHLICACTGMPRQDMEWLFTAKEQTPASTIAELGTMQPTSGFGEVFQYSNLLAAAAGFVGGALAHPGMELGAAYDAAMRERVFEPLGMTRTTFDFARAMHDDYARPHGIDVDGKAALGTMALNYTVVPARPAGGVWTSANDFIRFVEMELALGKSASGARIVSEKNLLARRAAQVLVGEDVDYGMGLTVDRRWGIPIVRHGGDLAGYHSDMMWLPEHGVGAVILTNGDWGWGLRGPLLRRLVEVLFDGRPEAQGMIDATVAQNEAAVAKFRGEIELPPNAKIASGLAARYVNDALGDIRVTRNGADLVLDVGEWSSHAVTRKNEDGTTSLVTIDPTLADFVWVVGTQNGRRTLVLRDAQHEYVFTEAPDKQPGS
jgi:CubicO group peptidase (beta-lactamase class C family)